MVVGGEILIRRGYSPEVVEALPERARVAASAPGSGGNPVIYGLDSGGLLGEAQAKGLKFTWRGGPGYYEIYGPGFSKTSLTSGESEYVLPKREEGSTIEFNPLEGPGSYHVTSRRVSTDQGRVIERQGPVYERNLSVVFDDRNPLYRDVPFSSKAQAQLYGASRSFEAERRGPSLASSLRTSDFANLQPIAITVPKETRFAPSVEKNVFGLEAREMRKQPALPRGGTPTSQVIEGLVSPDIKDYGSFQKRRVGELSQLVFSRIPQKSKALFGASALNPLTYPAQVSLGLDVFETGMKFSGLGFTYAGEKLIPEETRVEIPFTGRAFTKASALGSLELAGEWGALTLPESVYAAKPLIAAKLAKPFEQKSLVGEFFIKQVGPKTTETIFVGKEKVKVLGDSLRARAARFLGAEKTKGVIRPVKLTLAESSVRSDVQPFSLLVKEFNKADSKVLGVRTGKATNIFGPRYVSKGKDIFYNPNVSLGLPVEKAELLTPYLKENLLLGSAGDLTKKGVVQYSRLDLTRLRIGKVMTSKEMLFSGNLKTSLEGVVGGKGFTASIIEKGSGRATVLGTVSKGTLKGSFNVGGEKIILEPSRFFYENLPELPGSTAIVKATSGKTTPLSKTFGKEVSQYRPASQNLAIASEQFLKSSQQAIASISESVGSNVPRLISRGKSKLKEIAVAGSAVTIPRVLKKPGVKVISKAGEMVIPISYKAEKMTPTASLKTMDSTKTIEKGVVKTGDRITDLGRSNQAEMLKSMPVLKNLDFSKSSERITPLESQKTVPRLAERVFTTEERFFETPQTPPGDFFDLPEEKPVRKIPPIQIFSPKLSKDNLDFEKGFDVFAKRQGQWFKLSDRALSKQAALSLGGKWASETAGASFSLKPGKELVKKESESKAWNALKNQFYKKGQAYIEKPSFRIDMPGEKKEITFKGLNRLFELKKGKKSKGAFVL